MFRSEPVIEHVPLTKRNIIGTLPAAPECHTEFEWKLRL